MRCFFGLLLLVLGAFSPFPGHAQRVGQIKEIAHRHRRPQPDTIVTRFLYQDTRLTTIEQTRGTKVSDRYSVEYKKNKVVMSDQDGKLRKSFIYDKDTPGRLIKYWNDPNDQYEFSYDESGERIQRIDCTEKIDKYNEANEFIYQGDRLTRVKVWNKKADRSSSTDYVISYADGKVDHVVWGNHIRSYELDWTDDQVSSVLFSQNKDAHTKHYFSYDPSGNISEQREYAVVDGEEKIQREYFITYQDQAGNDEMLFDLYHWQYNLILGIKTFSPFQQQRY